MEDTNINKNKKDEIIENIQIFSFNLKQISKNRMRSSSCNFINKFSKRFTPVLK